MPMLYFASTSSDLDDLDAHPDIGVMTGPRVGGLGSILTSQRPWASDCDALSKHGFHYDEFVQHLRRVHDPALMERCRFVVVPDVPGCGRSTLAAFHAAAPDLAELGFPLAYCLQDGAEDLEFPLCDVAFLGGSDDWREAVGAALLERAADEGLGTHVGRVNSARRVRHLSFCHCDSVDGTYVGFRGVERGAREIGSWLRGAADEKLLGAADLRALLLDPARVARWRERRRAAPRWGEMQPGTEGLF
ncbi:hypothetical protein GCM10008960_32440 [Deinococcus sedimenti]|uniref:Uncharacterized protein n=2 Tax=Deinococcus sedimenti TaxID=1867090 RepID=A0ABQ2S731_9DEIO|nr:hypothetical protein GCM10008960_32440 [Deinococcus sedimenti]